MIPSKINAWELWSHKSAAIMIKLESQNHFVTILTCRWAQYCLLKTYAYLDL